MNIQSNIESRQSLLRETAAARTSGTPATPPATGAAARSEAISDGDEAHLSIAARSAAAASGGSDVRPEKVAAIQQALASGSYAVSASDVADKLIDHLLQN